MQKKIIPPTQPTQLEKSKKTTITQNALWKAYLNADIAIQVAINKLLNLSN